MKVKKHGNKIKETKTESFECKSCGCEFEAKEDEFYIDKRGAEPCYEKKDVCTISISTVEKDYFVCSCPECHKIVLKIHEREKENFIPLNVVGNSITSYDSATIEVKGTCEDYKVECR